MRIALDTNVLAYAEGVDGVERRDRTLDLLGCLPEALVVLPAQVLGELFNVLVRKADRTRQEARAAILSWQDAYPVLATTPMVMNDAAGLAADHRIGIWDAVVLAAAAEGGCRVLLSEDLQDGFTWRSVTVANPYSARPNPLLQALTSRAPGGSDGR